MLLDKWPRLTCSLKAASPVAHVGERRLDSLDSQCDPIEHFLHSYPILCLDAAREGYSAKQGKQWNGR